MSISQLESASNLPLYVKSLRTVEDVVCRDLTCRTIKADSILVDRETTLSSAGDMIIDDGDLYVMKGSMNVYKTLTVGTEASDNQEHTLYGSVKVVRAGTGASDGSQACKLTLCGGDGGGDYVNTASMLTMCSRTSEYMGDNYPDMRIIVGNPTSGYDGRPIRFNVGAKAVSSSGDQNEFTMFQFNQLRDPSLYDDPGYYTDFIRPVKVSGGIRGNVVMGRDDQASTGSTLQIHDSRLGSVASGQMFIEAGCTSDGDNTGWSAINWNGFYSGGNRVINPVKCRWRQIVNQCNTTDRFTIDTTLGSTATGYARDWLKMDAKNGSTEVGGAIFIDYRPESGARYVRPTETNLIALGAGSFRWKDVYSANGAINTSDRKKKKDIVDLPPARGMDFIKQLRPVEYRFKDGDSGRKHFGLIAQEVEDVFKADGDVDGSGNAIIVKSRQQVPDPDWVKPEDDDKAKAPLVDGAGYDYAMRYTELIAPMIKAIKELEERVAELER